MVQLRVTPYKFFTHLAKLGLEPKFPVHETDVLTNCTISQKIYLSPLVFKLNNNLIIKLKAKREI